MSEAISNVSGTSSRTYNELAAELKSVQREQGVLGNIWNGLKEATGLGQSYSDCESMLEKYKNGEVSITQAMDYIDDYKNKQDNMVELEKNIITGTTAIAASVASGGVATSAIGLATILGAGAATGAAVKTSVGAIDRATNQIEDDVLDTDEIVKDAISGSVTGATSAIPSEPFGKLTSGIKDTALQDVATKAICSAACGATSGSTSYLTDVALDEDKDFDLGDFASSTAASAVVSGIVGAGVGAFKNTNLGKNINESITSLGSSENGKKILEDSASSNTRKVVGREVNNLKDAVLAA